jgi:hypothetical protein
MTSLSRAAGEPVRAFLTASARFTACKPVADRFIIGVEPELLPTLIYGHAKRSEKVLSTKCNDGAFWIEQRSQRNATTHELDKQLLVD